MSINWNNIRPLNNSRNDGFEELICQIAVKEKINRQKTFRRIGKPDGGKECYWELDGGKQHMWQAKYFASSFGASQWTQVEDSVIRAIDNHPGLEKYYVCAPIDLPDPKVKGRKSSLDKWKEKSKEWENYAASKGMSVSFEYWGSTELLARLSKRENEGLKYFWFNEEELTDIWFENKNRESINALGARYTKQLNFNLPIAKIFDGLSRDKGFESQIHKLYGVFLEKYRSIRIRINDVPDLTSLLASLSNIIKEFSQIYESTPFIGNQPIPVHLLTESLKKCSNICSGLYGILHDLRSEEEKKKAKPDYYSRPYANEISEINSFGNSIYEFSQFLNGITCQLSNHPFLLVTGGAGIGKSHLLADIVEKRNDKKQISLLLLGENFTTEEMPWTQILHNQLRKIQLDEFAFLGALNAKAESEQCRIIIFIDALNEGNGRKVWPRRLKSFIESIAQYPWVGLVISLRSSFERLIAPTDEIKHDLIARVVHEGFAGVEYEAVKLFFQYYNIVQPSSPFLNPEFHNPLFLKLFCKALFERGLYYIPPGYESITTIIDYFLESINIKLARPHELHFDERKKLVQSAVKNVVEKMVDTGKDHIPYLEAEEIIDRIFRASCNNPEPFLSRLISEGVFNDDLYWDDKGNATDVVYFAYQRFQDHLTVSLLLDKYLNLEHPEISFQSGALSEIVKDSFSAYNNQHLVEALSIQIPERVKRELFELAPHSKEFYPIAEGFIQSLIWRKGDTIGESAREYVNTYIIPDESLFDSFWEVTILASIKPGFYFNANRLHDYLKSFSLAERDALWTVWLQNKFDNKAETDLTSAVKRMIDWAWRDNNEQHIQDDSILLGCTTLAWFLTSANRYLRDAATKGLVCLLQHRIHLIPTLLEKFKDVNDPYIRERLYASAYGAVLRTTNRHGLPIVAEYIFEAVFNTEKVYPHILLRDYARNIIEFAIYIGLKLKVEVDKIRPPYKSESLPKKFPSNAVIDKKYKPKDPKGNYGGDEWGATAILSSMTTEYGRGTAVYGDFGRYVFQRAFDDWEIDYNGLSNYAVQRIFEIGYNPKIFSEFDGRQGSGRSSGHTERIGKKYQWIIFYELLARVADQYALIDESDWERPKQIIPYEGPWYPYVRDIDPSVIIKETKEERYTDTPTLNWWFNTDYRPWHIEDGLWITDRSDIPSPEKILEVQDEYGERWLWLEIHPEWGQPEPLGADRYSTKRKRLWYQIRSFLVNKNEAEKLQKGFRQNFHRGEFPEARSLYTIFDKEYYWSPAFRFFNKLYYSGEDWVEVRGKRSSKIAEVYRTTEHFNWEEEFDCSKTGSIQFYKPALLIWDRLNMRFSSKEGELIDETGKVVCFDPSVHNKGVSGLLIRKKEMLKTLEQEGLELVWSIVGEKQFLGQFRERTKHPGRLNISGLYTLNGTTINGNLNFKEE